jgi:RHS repeat-associated protein
VAARKDCRRIARNTAVGGVTPSYDGNGNLASDGTFTYCYDAENRLTSVLSAGTCAAPTTTVATYAYDAQGRRKSRTVGGTTTIFVTDAGNREVLEYDGTTGAIQNWYAYGLGPNAVLNQMGIAASARATLLPDIQGSIVGTLDAGSGTLTKIAYGVYGEGATSGSFRYTGQRIDPESNGLYYYRARHYMPAWGRFMQVDPIGYTNGGDLFAYVGNDPLNLVDPFGFAADSPSSGQSLVQSSINAVVPGAYYADLARQQFQAGNYVSFGIYETAAFVDAAIGVATFGLSAGVNTGVRVTEGALTAAEQLAINRAAGAAFEQQTLESFTQAGPTSVQVIRP